MECACAMFSSVACPALQYFPTLSHKRQVFRRKKCYWTYIQCVILFSLENLSETFFIPRIKRHMIKNYSCPISMKTELTGQIFEKYSYHENPYRGSHIIPRGTMDGQAGVTMLIVAFRNSVNASSKPDVCLSVHRCIRVEKKNQLQSSNNPHSESVACCPAPDLRPPATKHCTP